MCILASYANKSSLLGLNLRSIECPTEARNSGSVGIIVIPSIPEICALSNSRSKKGNVTHTIGPRSVVSTLVGELYKTVLELVVDALYAVVHKGEEVRIAVEEVQELNSQFRILGSGRNSNHSALSSSGVAVCGSGANELYMDSALVGSLELITERIGLSADEIIASQLSGSTSIISGISDSHLRIDVTSLVVLFYLLYECLVFGSAELVDNLVAIDAFLRRIFRIYIVGEEVDGTSITGNYDRVGDHSLKYSALDEERILVGVSLLVCCEQIIEGIEITRLDIVKSEAELFKSGDVNVPAVLDSEVLVTRNSVDADAVCAFDSSGLPQSIRNSLLHVLAVSVKEVGLRIVKANPSALLGIAHVLVRGPGAGEVHVDIVKAVDSGDNVLIEIAPSAPDGLYGSVDAFFCEILISLLENSGIVGYVAAMEPDLKGFGCCSGVLAAICGFLCGFAS